MNAQKTVPRHPKGAFHARQDSETTFPSTGNKTFLRKIWIFSVNVALRRKPKGVLCARRTFRLL